MDVSNTAQAPTQVRCAPGLVAELEAIAIKPLFVTLPVISSPLPTTRDDRLPDWAKLLRSFWVWRVCSVPVHEYIQSKCGIGVTDSEAARLTEAVIRPHDRGGYPRRLEVGPKDIGFLIGLEDFAPTASKSVLIDHSKASESVNQIELDR